MPRLGVSRVLPYRPEQLFDLVVDVESYPEFLSWWVSAHVLKRADDAYYTDQIISFGPIRQRFSSKTTFKRPEAIEVSAIDGPFETFRLDWRFKDAPEGRCKVTLTGELELRTRLLRDVLGRAIAGSADSILTAFEERAERLYGASKT